MDEVTRRQALGKKDGPARTLLPVLRGTAVTDSRHLSTLAAFVTTVTRVGRASRRGDGESRVAPTRALGIQSGAEHGFPTFGLARTVKLTSLPPGAVAFLPDPLHLGPGTLLGHAYRRQRV